MDCVEVIYYNKKNVFFSNIHIRPLLMLCYLFTGTYKDGLAPDGKILSDHMLLGSVVATILIIDNTTQVRGLTSRYRQESTRNDIQNFMKLAATLAMTRSIPNMVGSRH